MTKYTVNYFDSAASRGEEVRLALILAGVAFDDHRIARADWPTLKPRQPFATLPVFDVEGHGSFGQSNAILRLIGRLHGLYPDDIYAAARQDALMDFVEELRCRITPTLRMTDPEARRSARQALATDYIPQWATCVERQLGDGPFADGAKPGVADVKLYIVGRWISSGILDDIPADVLDRSPRLNALMKAFAAQPAVASHLAAQGG